MLDTFADIATIVALFFTTKGALSSSWRKALNERFNSVRRKLGNILKPR